MAASDGGKSVCLIGSSGSGKSTFLAGLELLGGPDSPSRYALSVSRGGADMVEAAKTLRRGEWLPKTAEGYEVEGRLSRDGRSGVRLRTRDYDGRRTAQPAEDDMVRGMLKAADVVLLVLSADHTAEEAERVLTRPGGGVVDRDDERDVVLKALRARRDEDGARRHRWPVVAVLLTKADANPALTGPDSARQFLESAAPEAYRKLRELSRELAVFPVSAVGGVEARPDGSTGPARPPVPRGYDELLDWTFAQLGDRRRKWRRYIAVVAALAVVAVAALTLGGRTVVKVSESQVELARMETAPTLAEKARLAAQSDYEEVRREGVRQVRGRVEAIRGRLDAGPSQAELREFAKEAAAVREAKLPPVAVELEELSQAVGQQLRAATLQGLTARRQPGKWDGALRDDLVAFVKEFGGTAEAAEANKTLAAMTEDVRQEARRAIVGQHVPGRDQLEGKVRLVNDYMAKYRALEPRRDDIDRAVRVSGKLLARSAYKVILLSSGQFDEPRSHTVIVRLRDEKNFDFYSQGPRVETEQWNREFEFDWTAGDVLQVELWIYHGSGPFGAQKRAAQKRFEGAAAILALAGTARLDEVPNASWGYKAAPFAEFRVEGLEAADVAAVREFLLTSDGWQQ